MSKLSSINETMTKYRWTVCALLFFATTINYLDRQVLSLLKDSLAVEFNWTDSDYGTITAVFSLAYAIAMLFAGSFVDKLGTKRGYALAIGIWSLGACIHALCGLGTDFFNSSGVSSGFLVGALGSVSVVMFVVARCVLAIGEAGNFPAAIKATAEYFPKRDRAFATGIFNSGANVGAVLAPLTVPFIAELWGWEAAFLGVGATGFIWMLVWLYVYKSPENNSQMNDAERAYINQDDDSETNSEDVVVRMSILKSLKYRQTWAFALGKLLTDGVWWFYLFWTPTYLMSEYQNQGMTSGRMGIAIGVLYTITVFGSVFGGKFPTYFINKGMDPYAGRMKAMFIIALFPLLVLCAQPLGHLPFLGDYGYWVPVIIIGLGGSAHQAWSANLFSTVSDMFPKNAVATVIGVGGMAGGIGAFIINKGSGMLFDYSLVEWGSKSYGYTIIFAICAVVYLLGWCVMKYLVPKYSPIKE